jgi:hypothetical protein
MRATAIAVLAPTSDGPRITPAEEEGGACGMRAARLGLPARAGTCPTQNETRGAHHLNPLVASL